MSILLIGEKMDLSSQESIDMIKNEISILKEIDKD